MSDNSLPRHIAIIMDGNGRWAHARGLPRVMGHRAGVRAVETAIQACLDLKIPVLTLYTFSAENWKRPRWEIEMLMRLLEEYLTRGFERLVRDRVRVVALGRLEELPTRVREKLDRLVTATAANRELTLAVALNYGGRGEIVDAVRRIVRDVQAGALQASHLDEAVFARYLYTAGLPDPDLLIRTSGEWRLSNFLLWQVSYCELYVTETLWPDFAREDLEAAIADFQRRERRFGAATARA